MNLLPETPVVGIGLMSGTSADGIDAAAARLWREEGRTRVELLARASLPYPAEVREALLYAFNNHARTFDLCCLNARLGDLFADAAEQLAAKLEGAGPLAFVASHGQTVWHYPPGGQVNPIHEKRQRGEPQLLLTPSTLQLGEGARIAERLRVPVVCDFRQQDMAAGGQGAPLTPYLDYLLLAHPTENRAVQNLGGIGNVAYLPAGGSADQVIAFDTGPGNALIDGAASATSQGSQSYDVDGRMAASAPVDAKRLAWMLSMVFDEYLAQAPPKSTGRELFSLKLVDDLWDLKCRGKRLVSTLTQLTVETVADQYERWLGPIDRVILTGGGARNPELVKRLRARLAPAQVVTLDEMGIDSAAREALAFAVMGYETLCGRTSTLPITTGASRAVIQGKIVLA